MDDSETKKVCDGILKDAKLLVSVLDGTHPKPLSVPMISVAAALRDKLDVVLKSDPSITDDVIRKLYPSTNPDDKENPVEDETTEEPEAEDTCTCECDTCDKEGCEDCPQCGVQGGCPCCCCACEEEEGEEGAEETSEKEES